MGLTDKIKNIALMGSAGYMMYTYDLLKPSLKFVTAFSAVVLGSIYWFQNKLLYIPVPDPVHFPRQYQTNPKSYLNMSFEELKLRTPDGEDVFAWLIPQTEAEETLTVVYFHGNAGGIDHRLPFYGQMIRGLEVNVLAADYRGFGGSTGEPSEKGLKLDGETFVNHLLESNKKVVVFGRSLGGAVGIHVVSELEKKGLKVEALILENTFTNIRSMAIRIFSFLKPVEFLLKSPVLLNEWNSIEAIKLIKKTPVMMISGRNDELVPPIMMDELWKTYLATASKEATSKSLFFPVEKGGHNDTPIHAGEDYIQQMKSFLSRI